MSRFSTPQEEFWAGQFGNDYIDRNTGEDVVNSNMLLFGEVLRRLPKLSSVLELGCNIGLNLEALRRINPGVQLTGVEINERAISIAREKQLGEIVQSSILEKLDLGRTFDLTFTKTVLIHVNPEFLGRVYENLYRLSSRYVMVCEYYNPAPVIVHYRGHADRLFKRDFAGELMEQWNLRLIDYGFAYRRDKYLPYQDDVTWFLLEK